MNVSRLTVMSPGIFPSQGTLSASRNSNPAPTRTSPETIRSFAIGFIAGFYFFPKTALSRSVTRAAGSVRIFFSSSPTM